MRRLLAALAVVLVLAGCATAGTPVPLDQQVVNAVHLADAVVPGIVDLADSLHAAGKLSPSEWNTVHKVADDLAAARNAALAAALAYDDALAANPADASHDAELAAALATLNSLYSAMLARAVADQLTAPVAKAHARHPASGGR